MDIHIDLETVKFFVLLVISGVGYGYYCYRNGLKRGWDDCAYALESSGVIEIDDDGEILRVSDRDYHEFKRQEEY